MSFLERKLEPNIITTNLDYAINWCRKSAIWPMTFGLACCAIEMIASVSSRYDIDRFGEALTKIQILVGDAFAPTQGGRFASSEVADCVKAMLDAGAKGAGQSSWGPACYGLVRGTKAAGKVKKAALEKLDGESRGPVFISSVNNQGALITVD